METGTVLAQEGTLAVPDAGTGPGVLVLHAWWGLNDTMKQVCDRLARTGFVAFAPDLYHGQMATTIEEAEQLSSQLDDEQAKGDIAAAIDVLWERAEGPDRGIGVIGFSLGAYYAIDAAIRDPDRVRAVVLFYGTGEGDLSRSRAAFLGHFAENDPYESAEYVEAIEAELRQAGRPVTFYWYEGLGHWFFEEDRPDAYNGPAARLAWERTIEFLRRTLGG